MPRTPDIGVVRDVIVKFRLSPQEAEVLDARRGSSSRSDYLRRLVFGDAEDAERLASPRERASARSAADEHRRDRDRTPVADVLRQASAPGPRVDEARERVLAAQTPGTVQRGVCPHGKPADQCRFCR